MKTRSKALLLMLCAILLVAASVLGTMAYLTAEDSVTNTFTVGNVQIKLDEADVSTKDEEDRTQTGNNYHLLPGQTYKKDPTVTVLKDSEACYVRMKVKVKNLDKLKAAMPQKDYPTFYNDDLFLLQMLVEGWDAEKWAYKGFNATESEYEFRYVGTKATNGVVSKSTDSDTPLEALFEKIVVPGSLDNTAIANLKEVQIIVTAEAIQEAGFPNADAAWEAW